MKNFFPLFIILFLIATSCSNGRKEKTETYNFSEGMIWNTTYHLTYQGPAALEDSARRELERVGKSLNVFDTTSLVSRVNREDSVKVNDDFIKVYVMSRRVNSISDGKFDPTLGPLITAWGFGPGHKATADTARIDSILLHCGIEKTRLSHDALVKDDPRISFNFSAIAKGYGCDCVAEMFRRNGVTNFLVEIGGEIMTSGKSPSGGDWKVSVDRPIFAASADSRESQEVIAFTDKGMATSGNYRNFHKDGDKVYGHTISATTGRPVATDVISATVVAPSAMQADALATAFMAAGSAASQEMNRKLRLPVMLVLSDSTVWTSEEFNRLIPAAE